MLEITTCFSTYSKLEKLSWAEVSRCSKIVGSIGKVIENIFYTEVVNDYIPKASATDGSSRSKIKKFIKWERSSPRHANVGLNASPLQ